MDAGLLDMFHDAADIDILAIAQRVDIDLDGVAQEAVDQHRIVTGHNHRVAHIAFKVGQLVNHLHGASAKNVGGADDNRQANLVNNVTGLFGGMGDAVARLAERQIIDQLLETLAILGKVDGVRAGAEDRDPRRLQRRRDFQRRLAAKLHDHAMHGAGLGFPPYDLDHILVGQRLEIQPVGGIVIGRHGFRVAVDHDRLIAGIGQRVAGMNTAIVELDSLSDPVRPASQDHHLPAV